MSTAARTTARGGPALGGATRFGLLLLAAVGLLMLAGGPASAAAGTDVSRDQAVRQLVQVRASIDQTLALIKAGDSTRALAEARDGYLSHFELVEIPLRLVDARYTSDTETQFAEIRGEISSGASVDEIRGSIVELRAMIDGAERRLTDVGSVGPAAIATQSFVIIFREGLEAVLLVSVLLGYLEAAKASRFRRPIIVGMLLAAVATAVTYLLLRSVLAAIPLARELVEAVTTLVAVAVLFYVSFWLVARLEQKRWLEFLRARVWTAVSVGSSGALVLVGFTAIYREGLETALFYQALASFGEGLGSWILLGLGVGLVALTVLSWLILRLGRRLPIRTLLTVAVLLLMVTSVTMLGNAVRALQEADVVALDQLEGWPRTPIFVSQSLGYWPSVQTLVAQAVLVAVYLAGALYVFIIRPRRGRPAGSTSGGPEQVVLPDAQQATTPGTTSGTESSTSPAAH